MRYRRSVVQFAQGRLGDERFMIPERWRGQNANVMLMSVEYSWAVIKSKYGEGKHTTNELPVKSVPQTPDRPRKTADDADEAEWITEREERGRCVRTLNRSALGGRNRSRATGVCYWCLRNDNFSNQKSFKALAEPAIFTPQGAGEQNKEVFVTWLWNVSNKSNIIRF